MTLELALKCIDDLRSFDQKIKNLSFCATGEPLLNKSLPEIIQYAKTAQIAERIEFTTNASLMSNDFADKIINAGIDLIDVSIYGLDEESYFSQTKARIHFDKFINNLTYLYKIKNSCKIIIKIVDTALTGEADKIRFTNIFSDLCDSLSIEHVVPMWYGMDSADNSEESCDRFFNKAVRKRLCPFSFYTLKVAPDGKVSPCCADWQQKLIMGDVREQTLYDIWHSDTFRTFHINQLENGRNNITPCSCCSYPDYCALDDIDAYSDKILVELK